MAAKEKKKWKVFLTMSGICSSTNSEAAAREQLLHKFQDEVRKLSKKKQKTPKNNKKSILIFARSN